MESCSIIKEDSDFTNEGDCDKTDEETLVAVISSLSDDSWFLMYGGVPFIESCRKMVFGEVQASSSSRSENGGVDSSILVNKHDATSLLVNGVR